MPSATTPLSRPARRRCPSPGLSHADHITSLTIRLSFPPFLMSTPGESKSRLSFAHPEPPSSLIHPMSVKKSNSRKLASRVRTGTSKCPAPPFPLCLVCELIGGREEMWDAYQYHKCRFSRARH